MDDQVVDIKNEVYFKKLLRLNRLQDIETLSKEHLEILKKSDLLEDYHKFSVPSDNWYVRITPTNRKKVQEWLEKNYITEQRAYNIGSYYGILNKELYTSGSRDSMMKEITTEQFYRSKF